MPTSSSKTSLYATINHRHVASSISTNSELVRDIQDGTLSGERIHMLTADTQSAGRGQHGRSWQSPAGNVYLSLYHPISGPISGLLSLVVGVALADMPVIQTLNRARRNCQLPPIGVKWANDLGFYQTSDDDDALIYFSKLAGILIEPVWQNGKPIGVVLGIGLNVQSTPTLTAKTAEGMSYRAISLQDLSHQLIAAHETLHALGTLPADMPALPTLPSLTTLYEQMGTALCAAMQRFDALMSAQAADSTESDLMADFLQQFAAMDALAGRALRITQQVKDDTQTQEGLACGIDTHGCLQLRGADGHVQSLFTGRIDVLRRS